VPEPQQKLVWLSFDPADLPALPAGLDVEVFDASAALPPSAADVQFYVPDYNFDPQVAEVIPKLPRLSVVQSLTAGVEHLRPYVPESVTLCSARGVHDASTAELAMSLVLASLRGIPDFVRAQASGRWEHDTRPSLADKTVLILGYGSIGAAVERRLAGFECDVLRVARSARDGVAPLESLPTLLAQADVVIVTLPLTDETRGMVDADFLAAMRDGALLVNMARGPIVDTDALLHEVGGGRLFAALDVTDPEPLPAGHPLWTAAGVLISPHVGGDTSAFWPRAHALVRDQLERFAAGQPLANVVTGPY
jgi:phosphoglycerate dehydrogenase-like enzyme